MITTRSVARWIDVQKFKEVFRFELAYQSRRFSTWVYFLVLFLFGFVMMRGVDPAGDGVLTAPSFIAFFTFLSGVIWLLLAAPLAGDAAARDFETGMHPLTRTAPISTTDYLGGRFLAAFVLNASMLLALQAGLLISLVLPGIEPDLLGPLSPAMAAPFLCMALPNAFVATAIQFAVALRYGRAMAGYVASALLLVTSLAVGTIVAELLEQRVLGKVIDFAGFFIIREMEALTPIERNTASIVLQGAVLANRLVWITIGIGALAWSYRTFRFDYQIARRWSLRGISAPAPGKAEAPVPGGAEAPPSSADSDRPSHQVPRAFALPTYGRQTLALAWECFRSIAASRAGLTLIAAPALGSAYVSTEWMLHMSEIPLLPRTEEVLAFYAPSLRSVSTLWIIIPLFIVFYAGELVWRERDAGVSEIVDTSPVPEWALVLGKFIGLGLVITAWLAILMTAGMLVHLRLGYPAFELPVYVAVFFGFQLVDYLLLALLVLAIHVVVDHKHLGHVAALAGYGFVVFGSSLGIEHKLLLYGSDLGWSYTPMAGFGPQLWPWLWFKLYWAAWAMLLAVAARLLIARGRETRPAMRLRLARHRVTRATGAVAALAAALMLAAGGFIFYNTNVWHEYRTAAESLARRAEYERRYGQYEGLPQPQIESITLRVEIYPHRRAAEIRGSYQLVNHTAVTIDSIHVATAAKIETTEISFAPAAAAGLKPRPPYPGPAVDDDLDYRIYPLETPLRRGESVELRFVVRDEPRGFSNDGVESDVAGNGTYLNNLAWLPRIGYQANREIGDAGERRAHGLPPQPPIPPLEDTSATQVRLERVSVETVVGTALDQTAVAPGTLRRTWTENERRYFHYATDAPIGNEYALFSARYAVHHAEWQGGGQTVAIQVFHHPGHTHNLDRIIQSARASLGYYTTEFGPYPFREVRFIEHPGRGRGMHADNNTIDFQEGFSLLNPRRDLDPDLPFAVIAHEVAHQWWGTQLTYALVEGAGVLSESLATYSSMRLIEEALGREQLRRYLRFLRLEYELPHSRALPPLLRASDRFLFYRKGPLALYALSEYIGKERLHAALRHLLETHRPGVPPLPTTLDLYRELKAVTPPEHQTLLHDLFAANTFWDLETETLRIEPAADGHWQVTLDVRARKFVVDLEGRETERPMADWIEVGVYGANDELLYLQKHRIAGGRQTITISVPRQPSLAGVDPRYLLNDWITGDNVRSSRRGDDGFP